MSYRMMKITPFETFLPVFFQHWQRHPMPTFSSLLVQWIFYNYLIFLLWWIWWKTRINLHILKIATTINFRIWKYKVLLNKTYLIKCPMLLFICIKLSIYRIAGAVVLCCRSFQLSSVHTENSNPHCWALYF